MHPCVPVAIVSVVHLWPAPNASACALHCLPITNMASVVGQWKGHAKTVGHLRSNASVRIGIVTGGRYVIWRDGSQELETDAGRLSLVDGTLRLDAGRWPST